jgi:hypothetical protein
MYTGEEVAKLYKSGNPTLPYYIGASDLLSLLVSPAHIRCQSHSGNNDVVGKMELVRA